MDPIIAETRDNYNTIAEHFSNTRYAKWPEFEHFKHLVKDRQKIMDWGCGNGRYFESVKNKNIQYFGLDISKKLLSFAKQKYQNELESGKAHFYCTEKGEIEFPANFFDLVIMIASFHHLPSKETRLTLLKKIYKELKPGGYLVMTNWNLQSKWAKEKNFKKIGKNDFMVPWKNNQGKVLAERYYHSFTKRELKKLFKKSGFKIETQEYFNDTNWSDERGGRNLISIVRKV